MRNKWKLDRTNLSGNKRAENETEGTQSPPNLLKKTWEKVFCRPDYNWGKVLRVGGCPLGKTYEKLKQTIQEMFLCAHNLRHIHSGHVFSKFLSHLPHVQKVTLLARAISSESLLLVSTWKGSVHNPFLSTFIFSDWCSFYGFTCIFCICIFICSWILLGILYIICTHAVVICFLIWYVLKRQNMQLMHLDVFNVKGDVKGEENVLIFNSGERPESVKSKSFTAVDMSISF